MTLQSSSRSPRSAPSLGLKADQPLPPFLLIETPATDLTLQQGERITISWLDDAQHGAEIRLFADPDTGPTPWDQGGVSNEIPIPFSVDASDPYDRVQWHTADLNDDGIVNTQDFIIFLGAWAAGNPLADWNNDGLINTQDFIAFLADWAAGCL